MASRSQDVWLSLTALGRAYGISAVHCGRLLHSAGVRQGDGSPSPQALRSGQAKPPANPRHHSGTLWSLHGCGGVLKEQGLEPAAERKLVHQWADLLEALQQNLAAVSTSAEELASELPKKLVAPVNAELRQRGCTWQLPSRARGASSTRAGRGHRQRRPLGQLCRLP